MATTVTITSRGVERVRARHCWIYRSDLTKPINAQSGEIVKIGDARGRIIGRGFYSSLSQIALRVFLFEDREFTSDFWRSRICDADCLRQQVVSGTNAYRLVYAESDLIPSLIIDRYDDCFVLQTLSQGSDALKQTWIDLLVEKYHPRAIIERNDARVRDLEGLPRQSGVVYGTDPGEIVVEENGIRFALNLVSGQKTGAFLDQRENHIAAAGYARGRVLDCFAYEGGFALHLARNAEKVTAVDISSAAIGRAKRNAELNNASKIEFVEANCFDLLRQLEQSGERFDLINLDPPAFAKNKNSVDAAARGYKEINLRAMKLLNKGGFLISSTCSYHMGEEAFLNVLVEAASDANRSVQVIERRIQARDHPVLISMPETLYLKCMVLRVD